MSSDNKQAPKDSMGGNDIPTKTTVQRKIGIAVFVAAIFVLGFALLFFFINDSGKKKTDTIVKKIQKVERISQTYDFTKPEITNVDEYDHIVMTDLENYGEPGQPVLPYQEVEILIPQGQKIQSISIDPIDKTLIPGNYQVEPGQQAVPLSVADHEIDPTLPDRAIYDSHEVYPENYYFGNSVQKFRGYSILTLNLSPVEYYPLQGDIYYYKQIKVTVDLKKDTKEAVDPLFRKIAKDKELVKEKVDNPAVVEKYINKKQPPVSDLPFHSVHEYVIISNQTLETSWQPLLDAKTAKGLVGPTVVTTEYIYANYTGVDNQEKIRNFITDAYLNWQTEYVLLGGDIEVIPVRYGYGKYSIYYTDSIPTDLYYAALDGTWNDDGDTIWGEIEDNADLVAEVFVGRAPVETAEEVNNFISKTLAYDGSLLPDYQALLIGQQLNATTWAGDRKDEVIGYHPSQYNFTKLYDRDGTFSTQAVIDNLNSGLFHSIDHFGHSNYQTVMGLNRTNVDSLTNTDYYLTYSLGCHSAAFDNNDAIAEHFVFADHAAFAYIGNSRYGWYCGGTCRSSSAMYDREFFKAVYYEGERSLGKTLQVSKEKFTSSSQSYLNTYRWTYFALNLLGDPHVDMLANSAVGKIIRLTYPVGGVYDVIGTVTGDSFSQYKLEYASVLDPEVWTEISTYSTTVINDVLGQWDTTTVGDGTYYVRLSVSDNLGGTFYDQYGYVINVDNTYISSPGLNESFGGAQSLISVAGSVRPNNFVNYTVEHGLGELPLVWSSENVTLTNGGTTPVQDDELASWDISTLTEPGYHTIRLTANYSVGNPEVETVVVYIDQYQAGWPIILEGAGPQQTSFSGAPVIGNMDADAQQEVVAVTYQGGIYVWDSDGTELTHWPIETDMNLGTSPTLGDVNNDGSTEIVLASGGGSMSDPGIYIWDNQGNQLTNWPKTYTDVNFEAHPVLMDVNGDGNLEIIAVGYKNNVGREVYVWDYLGNELSDWPQAAAEISFGFSPPAAGDVDGDGQIEIFMVNGEKIYAWHIDGSMVITGWPKDVENAWDNTPTLADLDQNGRLEIIFPVRIWNAETSSYIYEIRVWHDNGEYMENWPQGLPKGISKNIVVGDVDNDGDLEIIALSTNDYINAYHHTGVEVENWPVYIEGFSESSPILVDVDGDNDLEIIFDRSAGISTKQYILQHDGSIVNGWPRPIYMTSDHSSAAGDLDADGDIELITIPTAGNTAYAWDLVGTYPSTNYGWPQLYYSQAHPNLYLRCSDGTEFSQCSASSLYCDNGRLWNHCNQCGYTCPPGNPICNADGLCVSEPESNMLDLIGLPVDVEYTCHSLVSETIAVVVNRWKEDLQSWEACADIGEGVIIGEDFPIELGKGYFVRHVTGASMDFTGEEITSPIPLALQNGLNLISIPYAETPYTCYSLIAEYPLVKEVDGWNTVSQLWETCIEVEGGVIIGDDFPIEPNAGYFMQVTSGAGDPDGVPISDPCAYQSGINDCGEVECGFNASGCYFCGICPEGQSSCLANGMCTSQCQDGIDNDGDTYTDFPTDLGCLNILDDSELNPTVACDDGIDNDSDGLIDYPDDPGCDSILDDNEVDFEPCGDGICEGSAAGEDCTSCPADCPATMTYETNCGDGVCQQGEDCYTCPGDCPGVFTGKPSGRYCCGQDTCSASQCGAECGSLGTPINHCCGDGSCTGEETGFMCEIDCGPPPECGDNVVEGDEECDGTAIGTSCDGECQPDCSCPASECIRQPRVCNCDGICNVKKESNATCPWDCP